jgi:hypothetical protein
LLQKGEKNKKKFHLQEKARLWKNKIKEITNADGTTISGYDQVRLKHKDIFRSYIQKKER